MIAKACCVLTAFLFVSLSEGIAADFGSKGGPEPANIDQISDVLRQDRYDMELLISFGTSKGGSAGHIALAVRNEFTGDDTVYSANFYADRAPEHATGYYTDNLMIAVPKKEYLFRTTSSLGDAASFGLDFGEIYKRSIVGVRVYNVPTSEKDALTAFFKHVNDDYHNHVGRTEYHGSEVVYDYLDLNCAKTIGTAFKCGAGYKELEVKSGPILHERKVKAALNASSPAFAVNSLVGCALHS